MKEPGRLTLATPTDREIVITRDFDAPRDLVFEAMSRPDILKRWLWGPPDSDIVLSPIAKFLDAPMPAS